MESTNSYTASTFSNDYNTEDTSFIGCISTEAKTIISPNNHLENINSIIVSISNWLIDLGASLHVTNSINLLKNINKCNENISIINGEIVTSTIYFPSQTLQFPPNIIHRPSDKEINKVLQELNPYKQTLHKSSNKRKHNYFIHPQ